MSGDTARSMSVRARINNLAKELGIAPQHALQRYFTERFLARIAASPYANNLAIKGGTLMSAILGVAHRTTYEAARFLRLAHAVGTARVQGGDSCQGHKEYVCKPALGRVLVKSFANR